MDFLGRIRKLDSSLQRGLDNGFARVFGGKIVPNELEECLKQEIEDFLMQDANGQFLAPNDFRIGVSPKDFDNLSGTDPELPRHLADRMTRYCRNNGWGYSGVVSVRIHALGSLHTGQLKTASAFTEDTVDHSEFRGLEATENPDSSEAAPLDSPQSPASDSPSGGQSTWGTGTAAPGAATPGTAAPGAAPALTPHPLVRALLRPTESRSLPRQAPPRSSSLPPMSTPIATLPAPRRLPVSNSPPLPAPWSLLRCHRLLHLRAASPCCCKMDPRGYSK